MHLENNQIGFFVFIGILGLASLFSLVWAIKNIFKQNRDLKAWRDSLNKGQMVIIDNMDGKQEVWRNNDDGTIVIRIHGPTFWFKEVNLSQVYPIESEIEYEIINK